MATYERILTLISRNGVKLYALLFSDRANRIQIAGNSWWSERSLNPTGQCRSSNRSHVQTAPELELDPFKMAGREVRLGAFSISVFLH